MADQNSKIIKNKSKEISNRQEKDVAESPEQIYQKLVRLMNITKIMTVCDSKVETYEQIAKQFLELSGYADSVECAEKCMNSAKKTKKEVKKRVYEDALNMKSNAKQAQEYLLAAMEFRKISGYQNADELASECEQLSKSLVKKTTGKKLTAFSLIIICFAAVLIFANTSFAKYHVANIFMAAGSYKTAISNYKKLDHYKDSAEKLIECEYRNGIGLMENGKYQSAGKAFAAAGDYKDSKEQTVVIEKLIIKNSKAGDIVSIGGNDWEILDLNDNQAFLLLKTALPGKAYNDSLSDVTWEVSSVRQWLNSDFITQYFSEAEKRNIVLCNVKNNDNQTYGIDGGNDTQDYIFFMSLEEAGKYKSLFPTFKSNCWLRSPGNSQSSAAFLSVEKNVMDYGYAVNSDTINVRPVMWYGLK